MKFRKIFLLPVIVLAFNIFIVNDISATVRWEKGETNEIKRETKVTIIDDPDETNTDKYDKIVENLRIEREKDTGEGNPGTSKTQSIQNILDKVLSWENRINFFGGIIVSCFNNYFKWWDYNPGAYRQFGCRGWRSGRFIKDIFQFEVNFINLGRGAFWLIATSFGSYKCFKKQITPRKLTCTAAVIMNSIMNDSWIFNFVCINLFLFLSSFQGFVSMPLTVHISNFSISVSLDSIIWGIIGVFLGKILEARIKKEEKEKEGEELKEV